MPKDLGSLAHIVIVSERLTILRNAVLHAILEVLRLGIAVRFKHTLQEDLFVLLAGWLVLLSRWANGVVDRLEDAVQPSVKSIMGLGLAHNIIVMEKGKEGSVLFELPFGV